MSGKAMEFSRRGDEVFGRLASRFPSSTKWRLMFEQQLQADRFAQIRHAMLAYLSSVTGSKKTLSEPQVIEQLLAHPGSVLHHPPGAAVQPKGEQALEVTPLHPA